MNDYIKAADPNLAWGEETSGWKQPALRPQRPSRSGKLSTTVRPPASAPPPTGRGHHPHRDQGVNRERPRARRRLVRTKKRRDYKANYSWETSLTSARTTEPALIRQVKRFYFNKRTSVSFTLTYIMSYIITRGEQTFLLHVVVILLFFRHCLDQRKDFCCRACLTAKTQSRWNKNRLVY